MLIEVIIFNHIPHPYILNNKTSDLYNGDEILLNKSYFDSDPAQFMLRLGACD